MELGDYENQKEKEKEKNYNDKIKRIFAETSINKVLVRDNLFREIPRYIFEWLLAKFTEENGILTPENKKKLYQLIEEHFPEPENIEVYKKRILKDYETIHILNKFKVSLNALSQEYEVYFPFFAGDSRYVRIEESIVDQYKGLLLNGLWGIATLVHDPSKNKPFSITSFSPVQLEEVYLEQYVEARKYFSLSEWVDLLINTMGLNPDRFPSIPEKIYLLTRMIPYVQNNYNLVEMGPKGTGKSFFHKNISTHVHVIGGGTISRAELIFHMGKKQKGILFANDVVVFDDFSNIRIVDANEVIGKLKNFMADGLIDVGSFKENSNASIVVMGNVELNEDGIPANRFYFKNLPKAMQESAFLDRISAFIPGWKIHPIAQEDLSEDYGLIGDWFSEILHSLRKKNFMHMVESNIIFRGEKVRARDSFHLKATASGLIKLLFPDGILDYEDWKLIAKFSCDLRQRVIDQLGRIDPEFRDIRFKYEITQ
ncbi:MAG: BREX system Lon protease-like protein BrxL [Promethearchaeota archaeon]